MMVRWTDAAMHGIAPATVRGGRDLVSEEWTSALSTCCTSGQHWSPTEMRFWLVPLSLSRHALLPLLVPAGPHELDQADRAEPEHLERSEEHTSELQSRGQLVCRL